MKGRLGASSIKSFRSITLYTAKLTAALSTHCTQQYMKPKARLLIPSSRAITCSTLTAPSDFGRTFGYLRALWTPAPAEHAWQYSHAWMKVSSAKKATTKQNKSECTLSARQHRILLACCGADMLQFLTESVSKSLLNKATSILTLITGCRSHTWSSISFQREAGFWVASNIQARGQALGHHVRAVGIIKDNLHLRDIHHPEEVALKKFVAATSLSCPWLQMPHFTMVAQHTPWCLEGEVLGEEGGRVLLDGNFSPQKHTLACKKQLLLLSDYFVHSNLAQFEKSGVLLHN